MASGQERSNPLSGAVDLVLLHGFAGDRASWDDVIAQLGARVDILNLPLPGHHPDAPLQPTFTANVHWVAELIQQYANNMPVHLVGYSMGARLSLGILSHYPERVDAVTLIGVHPGLSHASDREDRKRLETKWQTVLEERGIQAFSSAWENLPHMQTRQRFARDRIQRERWVRLSHDVETLGPSISHLGLAGMPDYRQTVRTYQDRIHLVTGSKDEKFSAIAENLRSACPRLRHTVLPQCGHNPLVECPRRVARLLSPPAQIKRAERI